MRACDLAILAILALATPVAAEDGLIHEGCHPAATYRAGDIAVSGAFTRAMLPRAPSAGGYLTITNAGSAGDRLVGANSDAAASVEVHQMKMEGDMMNMQPLPDGLEVPAGETIALSPGGLHLMFSAIRTPFAEGDCVAVTLEFERAGLLQVLLPVGGTAASAPPEGHAHAH